MNQETLKTLSLQQLEQYKRTLKCRIMDLHSFQIQLRKLNESLRQQINVKALPKKQQQKKVNATNFNFDDLYKIGKSKVASWVFGVNKKSVVDTYQISKNKVKQVANEASQFVKKTISSHSFENQQNSKQNAYDIQIENEIQDFRNQRIQIKKDQITHREYNNQKIKVQQQQEKQSEHHQNRIQEKQQYSPQNNNNSHLEQYFQNNNQQQKIKQTSKQSNKIVTEQRSDSQALNQIQKGNQQFKDYQNQYKQRKSEDSQKQQQFENQDNKKKQKKSQE